MSGSLKMYFCWKLPIFDPIPLCLTLFGYMSPPPDTHTRTFAYVPRRLWIFGWKIREWKEKVNFLVNSKRSMFFTQFYIQWQKNQNGGEKKCLRFFNKKAPLYAGLGSKQKFLPTSKQLIRKNSVCSFKNQVSFFHRANLQIDCLFSCAF